MVLVDTNSTRTGDSVHATETSLQKLLEGAKQYLVPLYQRPYSWGRKDVGQLWSDIVELAEQRDLVPGTTHFIGSVVLAPAPNLGPVDVQRYLVIDGQQRLTTLTLLLAAIRDRREKLEGPDHFRRIMYQFLANEWDVEHRLKLLPTQLDRAAYSACIEKASTHDDDGTIATNFRLLAAGLEELDDPDQPLDIKRIEDAVLQGLSLVCITASADDNAHRIFESLNNTGVALTQGDLLRNYLFMRMPTHGDAVYNAHWLPLQKALTNDQLETLFWIDSLRANPAVRQSDTYVTQKRRLDQLPAEADIADEVKRFSRLGGLYRVVLDPELEPDPGLRRTLGRLQKWGSTVVQPVLVYLLDEREAGRATTEQIARAAHLLESYLIRRLLIGRATAPLNRTMASSVNEINKELPVDQALHEYLSTGRKYFATDRQIQQALHEVPFYLNGRAAQRKLVLEWIEEAFGAKELVGFDNLSIEHVMPQTLTPEWEQSLAEDSGDFASVAELHEALTHVLGNLTLTGYNSELSNSPFRVKRAQLASSGLHMNQKIALHETWGRSQILERADALADLICKEWTGPVQGTTPAPPLAPQWFRLHAALAAMPPDSWTTYGECAALIGSHAVPVGTHLANVVAPKAYHVMGANGQISPGFRWSDPAMKDVDPRELLTQEGVRFDQNGQADPAQRLDAKALAELLGDVQDDVPDSLAPGPSGDDDGALQDSFLRQLTASQPPSVVLGVERLLLTWYALGGRAVYGASSETTCFLCLAREGMEDTWPLAIYPKGKGKAEVVFQWMANREPFDDLAAREELRRRLNEVVGIDLPADSLRRRPGFPLRVVASDPGLEGVAQALQWFVDMCLGRAELKPSL